jgi:tRNA 2-thiocytidine biosynthesis protein TtcA
MHEEINLETHLLNIMEVNKSADFSSQKLNSPLGLKIRKLITKALSEFKMIAPNDKLMICVSGGKDSTILSLMMREIQKKSLRPFSFKAVMLDQKQPGFKAEDFRDFMRDESIDFEIIEADTYSIVKEKIPSGQTYCSLCSRLRRGILYNHAHYNGFQKMLLGHHRNDLFETLLMNLFYSGQLASMPAIYQSKDKRNIVLRPMVYVAEEDIQELANDLNIPIIPCKLCGSQTGAKRDKMTKLLESLEKETPDLKSNMLNALKNIDISKFLVPEHNFVDDNFSSILSEDE